MASSNDARSEATRRALVKAARSLFELRGYSNVPAEEIVAAANVTRGALYHHFDGKEGLFREVLREVMEEIRDRIAAEARRAKAPPEAMERGVSAFLSACTEPRIQRVLLLDGPAVLGWSDWRAMDLGHGLGLLRRGLEGAVAAGSLGPIDVEVTTHLLAGALVDGAMLIGQAGSGADVRRRVEAALLGLLRGWMASGTRASTEAASGVGAGAAPRPRRKKK